MNINKNAILIGIVLATSYTFADYVVSIKENYAILDSNNAPYVIDSKQTANGGYIEWSNGYKEIWGQYDHGSNLRNSDLISISLPVSLTEPSKSYVNANVIGRPGNGVSSVNIDNISANSIIFAPDNSYTQQLPATRFTWTVKGF